MSEWVLSVTGLVFLTTILFTVLPQGKTGKVIKSVVSIMSLTVLLKPVISLKNSDFDINSFFSETEISLQSGFLDYTLGEKKNYLENGLYNYLNNEGFLCSGVKITLLYNDKNEISTNYVKIYLKSDASHDNNEHIVVIEKAKGYLSLYVHTEFADFEIYE